MKKWGRRLLRLFLFLALFWLIGAQFFFQFRMSDKKAKETFAQAGVPIQFHDLQNDGCTLHYAQTGDSTKPTLLFLHGSPGSWSAFAGYMQDKELLQHYRMVSIDRPGFGYSNFGRAERLPVQANLLQALLHKLQNGKPLYAIGHSLGGPLVVKLAAQNPQSVQGLVLLAASVDPSAETPERWRPVLDAFPLRFFIPGAFRPSNRELWWFKKDVLAMPEELAQVQCPVFIVHGTKDSFVPLQNATYAQQHLKEADTVQTLLLPDADHFIPWNRYGEIKDVLMKLKD